MTNAHTSPPLPRWAPRAASALRRAAALLISIAPALVAASIASGCEAGPAGKRALIVVDASDSSRPEQAAFLADRRAAFEKERGREVRVLHVSDAEAAIELAARGEADVAVLREGTPTAPLDRFLASDHGREIGVVSLGSERLKIIAVNAKQHPKVDAQGEALAQFMLSSGAPR